MRTLSNTLSLSLVLASLVACDDGGTGGTGGAGASSSSSGGGGASAGGANTGGSDLGGASSGGASTGGGGEGATGGGNPGNFVGRCGEAPPAGATVAAPIPTYQGTCPTLEPGANTLVSSGNDREFILVLPENYDPNASYPVFFLWHWLGGSADEFLNRAEVQLAANTQNFIAVIPEKKGDIQFVWPYDKTQSQARVDEELAFFDDMLSCVASAFSVDNNCVASVGVSAGALFTGQLAHQRSTHLSSFVSLSGGTGGFAIKDWGTAEHRLPGLVLWGGSGDTCQGLLSFEDLSADLEQNRTEDGHFFVECIHNCGHSEPPFEGPQGFSKYKGMWDFILDHPYWNSPGQSIYLEQGVPADLPEWCGLGAGSAVERTGECINPSEC